jgi:hypothetical protein
LREDSCVAIPHPCFVDFVCAWAGQSSFDHG